jgi:hypothetical protein
MLTTADGSPDFDAMWERSKDFILERQPGVTKEVWIAQQRERMSQMGGAFGGQGGPRGGENARNAQAQTQAQAQPTQQRTPSRIESIIKTDGHYYQGEYVLLPGMTANVTIVTNQRTDVLRVPAAALRFDASQYLKDESRPGADPNQPGGQQGQQGQQRPQGQQGPGGMMGGGNRPIDRRARIADRGFMAARQDRVWTLDEKGKPVAINVKAGLTDNTFTEVTGEGLTEGMELLVGVNEVKGNNPAATNPFQMGGGMRR